MLSEPRSGQCLTLLVSSAHPILRTNQHQVDRVFVHALNTVKRIPRTGSARPPPAARLKLYGLYKQSMEGDVEGVMTRPEGNGPDEGAEQEKWYRLPGF